MWKPQALMTTNTVIMVSARQASMTETSYDSPKKAENMQSLEVPDELVCRTAGDDYATMTPSSETRGRIVLWKRAT